LELEWAEKAIGDQNLAWQQGNYSFISVEDEWL